MLFNSIEFLFYLPIVFLFYWYVFQRNLHLQNLFIVIVSYIFYGWWDWRFLLLIAFTSFLSWFSGVCIDMVRRSHKSVSSIHIWCKGITIVNIGINLAILGLFKYYAFFVESFINAFDSVGISLSAPSLNLILPVGISFYTFQALSYTIDVYKKKLTPTHDIVAFFAYVSFFPQLVAGPIERATNLLPQFYRSRQFDYSQAVDGMRQILWGMFKKVVIADNCATMVNIIFENYQQANSAMLLMGAFFFTFQIYGDFSGYSDIAIGTARLFGIELKRNFHYPYFSRDVAEFWRRWHISLNTWFRDYVYIPLGGSRCSKIKQFRNTMVIFVLSGLWHGANWTYVTWGVYHALLFLPLLFSKNNRRYLGVVAEGKTLPSWKEGFQILITFGCILLGWILFRAETMGQAVEYIKNIFINSPMRLPNIGDLGLSFIVFIGTIFFIAIFLIIEWLQRSKEYALQIENISSAFLRRVIYFVILLPIIFFPGKQAVFIYFQF